MVLANSALGPRTLPWFVVFVLGADGDRGRGHRRTTSSTAVRIGAIVVSFAIGLIILVSSFRRSQLGVAGVRGESMLVDLRDRITKQGQMPALPANWYAESVTRSAGASSFAGDFMVASLSHDGTLFQVAVVDVSGKGEQAGTRSLLLSGAFGGLLGALPAEGFLPAANDYLLRQDWPEGFATAVHLSLSPRHRGLRDPLGRPPAGGADAGRVRTLGGARGRGADPGAACPTRSSPSCRGGSAAATRC